MILINVVGFLCLLFIPFALVEGHCAFIFNDDF